MTTVAVIGGSGLYNFPGLKDVVTERVTTPFGDPSEELLIGRIEDTKVIFLARHGKKHSILPSEINFRANIYALKKLGAEWCIGIGAVGSLKEECVPGHMVIPDQIIDWTKGRANTFFGEGLVAHVSMADPFCPVLRENLISSATRVLGASKVHKSGTAICIEGPTFSSRAESNLYRSWGATIIGMTSMPEAKLAREAEIAYASLNLVTDYDCWREGDEAVDSAEVVRVIHDNASKAQDVVRDAALNLSKVAPSDLARDSLKHAIVTALGVVDSETLNELRTIIGRYEKKA